MSSIAIIHVSHIPLNTPFHSLPPPPLSSHPRIPPSSHPHSTSSHLTSSCPHRDASWNYQNKILHHHHRHHPAQAQGTPPLLTDTGKYMRLGGSFHDWWLAHVKRFVGWDWFPKDSELFWVGWCAVMTASQPAHSSHSLIPPSNHPRPSHPLNNLLSTHLLPPLSNPLMTGGVGTTNRPWHHRLTSTHINTHSHPTFSTQPLNNHYQQPLSITHTSHPIIINQHPPTRWCRYD